MTNKLNYTKVGDYQLPNLTLPQSEMPLGKYGRMRRTYLLQEHPTKYNIIAPERDAVPALERGAADGETVAGTDRADASPEQGDEPDAVSTAHERPEEPNRGEDSGGADLQLSFLGADIPTEAEQIEAIDRAENEKSSSAFSLSQAEIKNELRQHGTGFMDGKKRVMELYQAQPDRKLRAKALVKEFGTGGNSTAISTAAAASRTTTGGAYSSSITLTTGKRFSTGIRSSSNIDLMIQSDRYLTNNEKELRASVQEAERQLPVLDDDAATEYSALKALYRNTLVGFYLFYSEDSHTISRLLNSRLLSQENAPGKVNVSGFVLE